MRFTCRLLARVIKYLKRRNRHQLSQVHSVHWADVTIFQRFENQLKNYPASRSFFESGMVFNLAFAKPFMTVRSLRSQGKFENISRH